MKASELRQKYINFFKAQGHAEIPGASLVPENDPTVLFTTAGMHPLVPYLMGESHPAGTRLVDVQRCVRTGDIDEVGDNTHLTLFEMLGNWSLGDYFKKEAIEMSYKFLTEELGLDPDRLAVSVFAGDDDAPFDEEAASVWESLGFVKAEDATADQKRRIFSYPKKENWWGPAGLTGPCGPDTEMFYYNSDDLDAMWDTEPSDDDTPWVEIWNDVFMQYDKQEDGSFVPLAQQNVDTGMGLERVTAIMQGVSTAYETELFKPAMDWLKENATDYNETSARIIADHLKAATFMIGDERGVTPGNNDQAYVLRRLIRRAIRHSRKLGISGVFCAQLAGLFVEIYGDVYGELKSNKKLIVDELNKEESKFAKALVNGENEIDKDIERAQEGLQILSEETRVSQLEKALNAVSQILAGGACLKVFNSTLRPVLGKMRGQYKGEAADMNVDESILSEVRERAQFLIENGWILRGDRAFYYFESHGFPLEMTKEIFAERGIEVDEEAFNKAFEAHQEKSRAGAEQKFAGGLADHSEETKKLHTATHLMLEALRQVLGKHVEQKGSNITAERLRFDFNHPEKVTREQLDEVERIVNEAIAADHPVSFKEMSVKEAQDLDATGVFVDKYKNDLGGKVKVYFMGDFSKEICGGPHVEHTGQLGKSFKIVKEQSSSSGVRRIKAVLK